MQWADDDSEEEASGRRLAAVAVLSGIVGLAIGRGTGDSPQAGPYPLFVMEADISVGDIAPITFFEPRYRWMCRQLIADGEPYYFGFITSGVAAPGNVGLLCEMRDFGGKKFVSENFDGTFDVTFRAVSQFTLVEVYREQVPSGPDFPPLSVGYVTFAQPSATS